MIDNCIALLAPHLCSGCGFEGAVLCENCKYDIISEPFSRCVACGKDLAGRNGLCGNCNHLPYQRGWCVGERQEQLRRIIGDFKFNNVRAAHKALSELLDAHLPELPPNTVIVPVPTVSSHIRQRGYDHMLLIARQLARTRHLPVDLSLQRATSTKQRGAGKKQRIEQARAAYLCGKRLDPGKVYLLVDDVVTTGATMQYAAQTLRAAGAETVWVASISRQMLD